MLLHGRGSHTISAEAGMVRGVGGSPTFVNEARNRAPICTDHCLVDKHTTYPLRVGVNTIGRLPDNDVVVQGPYVSRRHCAILVHAGDGCELYDIASKNGTFINGLKLSGPTHLAAGDEIRMCDRQFVFMSKHGPGGQAGNDCTKAE